LILSTLQPIFAPFYQLHDYPRGIFVPIYEYQCENCEHKMEAIQKISDAPLKDCPECKQETLRKLVSAAAFKLTGTGWYVTDFKDNKSKAREDKKPSSNNKAESTKETKGKESNNSGKKSEPRADKPKKKETVRQS